MTHALKDDPDCMIGNSSQIEMLGRLLRQSEHRHRVISQNIANVNTPGYRSQEARFAVPSSSELKSGQPDKVIIAESPGGPVREDGNNVDLDHEMSAITRNAMEFETWTQLLVARISQYRSAITGQ